MKTYKIAPTLLLAANIYASPVLAQEQEISNSVAEEKATTVKETKKVPQVPVFVPSPVRKVYNPLNCEPKPEEEPKVDALDKDFTAILQARINKGKSEKEISEAAKRRQARRDKLDFDPSPAIWKLSDSDTEIYFFGTFHALPFDLKWESDAFVDIFCQVDKVYFEIDSVRTNDKDPSAKKERILAMSEWMKELIDESRPPLTERINPELLPAFWEFTQESSAIFMDIAPTWFVTIGLAGDTRNFIGLNSLSGVERKLTRALTKRDIPIAGLETGLDRFKILNAVPEEQQREWLNSILIELNEELKNFSDEDGLVDPVKKRALSRTHSDAALDHTIAWAKGELEKLSDSTERKEAHTEIIEALLDKRNALWTDRVINILDDDGKFLVAVGAAHLRGENSLQELLAAKGYNVERIH